MVISGTCERRDEDITEQRRILGSSFDDIVLCQDDCQRCRGEVLTLLRR